MTRRRVPKHVVDFHTHAFPEKVAGRAIAALTAEYQVSAVGEATISGLIESMDAAGVDASVVVPVATRADQVRSINDWAASIRSERIVCFGALHPELPDPASEVERIVEMGLKGVKLQPNFQRFSPDDRRLWPAYEAAEERLVIAFHSGQEIRPLDYVYARPAAVARVHAAFPGLKLVLAHMGGYQMWDEVREHLVGRQVWFDTSYCREDGLSDEKMAALICDHGAERVLFGTDFPWSRADEDIAHVCDLGLEEGEVEAIAWQNARDLLGLGLE